MAGRMYLGNEMVTPAIVSGGVDSVNGQTGEVVLTASDVNALPDTTKYAKTLGLSMNQTTFVLSWQLYDQNGDPIGQVQTVDLPLESVVVSGSYDSVNKKIVLTLENGTTVDVPVGDLVAGLQSEITITNMLSSDLVDDTNKTHKFVTTEEKTTWNGKQAQLVSGTNIKTVNNNSLLGNGNINIDSLPSQSGQSGKYLKTNGTTASWGAINLSGYEQTSNKVTEVDDDSTDTQYPSAKAVYNVQLDLEDQLDDEARVRSRMDNQLSDRINNLGTLANTAINKVEKCVRTIDVTPIVDYDLLNIPVQYKGTTTQDFVNGYFYKFTNPVYSSSATVQTGSFTVTVDTPTFVSKTSRAGTYSIINYGDGYWYSDGLGWVTLSSYGITITGEVNDFDEFIVDLSMTTTATRIDVQPSNAGTVTSVNNVQPVNGNVTLTASDVGAVATNTPITGATKCKITYDSKGLVTAGSDLSATDIPSLSLSKITDVTATASELNVLDGITATTTELNYVDGVTSSIQTQLNGKASRSLDNLSADGQMIIDSQNGTISNCILDIPQDIKLELNNGTLTLKSGSILTTPSGEQVQLTYDKVISWGGIEGSKAFVIVRTDNQGVSTFRVDRCTSGSIDSLAGTTYHVWFDTTNNVIKCYSTDVSTPSYTAYLPIAIITFETSGVKSVDQVFNGAGYIGHHAFVLPDVKALIPDGFNDDGSLKILTTTTSSLRIVEMNSGQVYTGLDRVIATIGVWSGYKEVDKYTDADFTKIWLRYYVKENNKIYVYDGSSVITTNQQIPFVFYNYNGTSVTQFDIRQPVRLATTEMLDKKQDVIPDLDTIRSGASAGATALQPNDNITELNNNAGYITGITSSMVTSALGYTPYNGSVMTGADGTNAGTSGLVPAPSATDNTKYLRGDGTWQTVSSGGSYSAGTGIDITNNTISVTSPTLTNTATVNSSLTINGSAITSYANSINIGNSSSVSGATAVAIGSSSKGGAAGVSIGYNSSSYTYGTSIGYYAKNTATYAIQLGYGTNSEANSFYVGTSSSNNWKLLGSDGKIPDGRLPIATSVSSSSTNADVVGAKLFYDTCGDIVTLINAL